MDLDALQKQLAHDYSSSDDSSDDGGEENETNRAKAESSSSDSDVGDDPDTIEQKKDELRERLELEGLINQDKDARIIHVDNAKTKKKRTQDYDLQTGEPLAFSPEILACFNQGFKCSTVHKNTNGEFGDFARVFCFPFYYYALKSNDTKSKKRVLKMEIRDQKLALHGVEFMQTDQSRPNEHQLYRLDGNLTNQPPMMSYDESGNAKIVENQTACWMELDDATKGVRFIKKCTITDEIVSQIRLYPDKKDDDGHMQIIVENNRYRDYVKVSIHARYHHTDEKALGER